MGGSILFATAGSDPENLWIFDPVSPAGASIRDLAMVVFAITGFIFLIVESVLIYSIVRFRRQRSTTDERNRRRFTAAMPSRSPGPWRRHLIVFILILVVARTEWEVRPTIPPPKPGDNALYVTVIGRQWWWEYRYEYLQRREARLHHRQ